MRLIVVFALLFFFLFQGCGLRQRELELNKKETALNQKEQELLLKEKTLQLRDEELQKKQQTLDSALNRAKADTVNGVPTDTAVYNPDLVGMWSARMVNTETSCTDAAIGDTKTEQWHIQYEDKNIFARVYVNNKLVRVYSGTYTGNVLDLTAQLTDTDPQHTTRMVVHLRQTAQNRMEGRREITRPEGCKIVYSVELVK